MVRKVAKHGSRMSLCSDATESFRQCVQPAHGAATACLLKPIPETYLLTLQGKEWTTPTSWQVFSHLSSKWSWQQGCVQIGEPTLLQHAPLCQVSGHVCKVGRYYFQAMFNLIYPSVSMCSKVLQLCQLFRSGG